MQKYIWYSRPCLACERAEKQIFNKTNIDATAAYTDQLLQELAQEFLKPPRLSPIVTSIEFHKKYVYSPTMDSMMGLFNYVCALKSFKF